MNANRTDRWSAIVLIVAPLLSIFAMAHHPSSAASSTAERLAETVREAPITAIVHGGLLALMVAILIGLLAAAGRLGWSRGRVRAGAVAYSLGVVCMLGAAIVSGFLVPDLAARYVASSPAEMEAAVPAFQLAHATNQALAKIGAVAMSAGISLWSLILLGRRGLARGLGAFGLIVGLVPVVGLLFGSLQLDVHGMLLVVVAQSLWTVGVGVWMLQASAAVPAAS